MKYTLHLANNSAVELEADRIMADNVVLPGDHPHPHNMRLWVIGNEYGALGAVWASHEQDAFDQLVDAGLGEALLIEPADETEESAHLGNAGEAADLDNAWMSTVVFDPARDIALIVALARADGACESTLDH